MIKFLIIGFVVLIGVADVLLILGCGILERRNNKR